MTAAHHRLLLRFQLGTSRETATRTERVLATARFFLASASLTVTFLAPTEPRQYVNTVYLLLAAYFLWSTFVLATVQTNPLCSRRFQLTIHGVDLLWPAFISLLTQGPGSPFYTFFIFVLIAAACRWGFWGTLASSVGTVLFLLAEAGLVSSSPAESPHPFQGEFGLHTVIMRSVYLLMIGLLVGYLGEDQRQLRLESSAVAGLLSQVMRRSSLAGAMQTALDGVWGLFRATRVVLALRQAGTDRAVVWEARPRSNSNGFRLSRVETEASQQEAFFFDSAYSWVVRASGRPRNPERPSFHAISQDGRRQRDMRSPIPPVLLRSCDCQSILSVSVGSWDQWSGRLFVFSSRKAWFWERALRFLCALVREVGPAVYAEYLAARLRTRTETLERARIARELHDGVVQSLTTLDLYLETVRRQTTNPPPCMSVEIDRIQRVLRNEVARLREMMSMDSPAQIGPDELKEFIAGLVSTFRLDTGIAASFEYDEGRITLPARVCREIARIVQESLVNVRKHSGAHSVTVQLKASRNRWVLVIDDDGRGFDFSGCLSHAELDALGKGPKIIRERVRLIQGEMRIISVPDRGATLEIMLPY